MTTQVVTRMSPLIFCLWVFCIVVLFFAALGHEFKWAKEAVGLPVYRQPAHQGYPSHSYPQPQQPHWQSPLYQPPVYHPTPW